MKLRTLLAFLLLIVAGMQSVRAQEAYAVYTSNNTTLRFYYDNLRSTRTGTIYDVPQSGRPQWSDDSNTRSSVTKVVFDISFANARPTTTSYWFRLMDKLQSFVGMSYLNTSEVTNMSSMFERCESLTNLDVSNFNTTKVTNMASMFERCKSLTTLDVSNFNTANVTSMFCMFATCSNLSSLNLSNWDVSNVQNMNMMFLNCISLTSLDLSSFNSKNATSMMRMFDSCLKLEHITFGSLFNTSALITTYRMFAFCSSLTTLDLSCFDTGSITSMDEMFSNCKYLKTIYVDSGWNTENVTSSNNMFKNCTNLEGCQGTTYDDNHVDVSYAHFDGGPNNPGYLSALSYNLYVNGVEITNANKSDVLGEGSVIYDSTTKTLTLKGGTIQGNNTESSFNQSLGCGIYSEVDGLTIDVQGNTTVQGDDDYEGIYLKGNSTIITGNAKATVSGYNGFLLGAGAEWLVIRGNVELEVTGVNYTGLYGYVRERPRMNYLSTLTIKDNAKVRAKGNDGSISLGGWKEIILDPGFSVTAPEGASVGAHSVVDANGNDVKGEWVVIERTSLRGDVNLDKSVDIADAVCVLNAMAGQSVTGDANVNGDYDENGNPVIDIADLVTVLNIMAGQ